MEADSSPSKKRKLSPTRAVAIPPAGGEPSQPTGADVNHPPTFTSPTKSSPARFHPSLLPPKASSRSVAGSPDRRRKSLSPFRPGAKTLEASERAATSSPTRKSPGTKGAAHADTTKSQSIGRTTKLQSKFRPTQSADPAARQDAAVVGSKTARSARVESTTSTRGSDRDAARRAAEASSGREEPELPPTPEQLGLEPPSKSPKGLASSSPLKAKGNRQPGASESSPLKPRSAPAPSIQEAVQDLTQKDPTHDEGHQPQDIRAQRKEAELQLCERRRKEKELRDLRRQCGKLLADVNVLQDFVKSDAESTSLEVDVIADLTRVLTSANPSHKPPAPPPRSTSLSAKLAAFFPFSKPSKPRYDHERSPSLKLTHGPIQVLDPPEFRTAFTPFTLSSTKTLLNPLDENDATQLHNIELASPRGLLTVKFDVRSNTATATVDSIDVSGVSPWAKVELGQWLRKQAHTGDISSMGWACGRFWKVACLRAQHWLRVQALFPDFFRDTENMIDNPFVRQDDGADEVDMVLLRPLTRRALYKNIGRQSLVLSRDRVSLLFSWWIAPDTFGEVASEVDVAASYPKVWETMDERGSLKKPKEIFHRIRERNGILEATQTLVRIFFSS